MIVKALKKYQYTIMEPDALFVMVTDAEQVQTVLIKRLLKKRREVGQLCLNDDVAAEEPAAIEDVRVAIKKLFNGLVPEPSRFE